LVTLEACPPAVRVFVTDFLDPLLNKREKDNLQAAEGQWPNFPSMLLRMADKHPVILLGKRGPTRFGELPADVMQQVARLDPETRRRLREAEGRWPDYAIWVTVTSKNKGIDLKAPLGACSARDTRFDQPTRDFIRRLTAHLYGPMERKQLTATEGRWPDYPLMLLQLAAKHHLALPPGGSQFHLPYLRDNRTAAAPASAR
jgi:hypothetical protein